MCDSVVVVVAAVVLTEVAALLHVYIWYLESVAWTTAARRVFGTSLEEAQATKDLAYNQGFYNLFLAVMAIVGGFALMAGHEVVAWTLMIAAVGCMAAAATVLFLSDRSRRGAAIRQGFLPVLALVALGFVLAR